ncbi:hypothetical protein PR048_029240 [Dryococelus australis]|uniref:Uncharacterized protein n=1 Tax=Dryococelus australis TaxID=614101 RepID=A0ABQ9GFM7_9NEOP|nr:hypothetical protein PR048_029240 [Dryococelus australis]
MVFSAPGVLCSKLVFSAPSLSKRQLGGNRTGAHEVLKVATISVSCWHSCRVSESHRFGSATNLAFVHFPQMPRGVGSHAKGESRAFPRLETPAVFVIAPPEISDNAPLAISHETPQSCLHQSINWLLLQRVATWKHGTRYLFPCKSAIGSESSKACLMNYDPITKFTSVRFSARIPCWFEFSLAQRTARIIHVSNLRATHSLQSRFTNVHQHGEVPGSNLQLTDSLGPCLHGDPCLVANLFVRSSCVLVVTWFEAGDRPARLRISFPIVERTELLTRLSEFQIRGSGWTLKRVIGIQLATAKYNPLNGASYMDYQNSLEGTSMYLCEK